MSDFLVSLGFKPGLFNPCVFWHPGRGIRTLVRGDDYASTGSLRQLNLFKTKLQQKFEMKTQLVCHVDRADVLREAKIVNRVVRTTQD